MAANRKTLDTDMIFLREVYARTGLNQPIPQNQVLISDGDDSTHWGYLKVSTFNTLVGNTGPSLYADDYISTIHISTSGPTGLLTSIVDLSSQALMLNITPPVLGISQKPVPNVTTNIAAAPPSLFNITNYSTVNWIGVEDVLFSTVMNVNGAPPAVFVSISSFTSAGYSSISGETFSLRPYLYNVLSTAQGRPTFTSSIATTWATGLQNLSTSESYPNYLTGDVYFSTVSINMEDYIGYIEPGVSKVVLEVAPTYLLPRFFLGQEEYPNLLKNISSYIQYSGSTTSIVANSQNSDMIVSQQSNAYTSNYFNKPMKLPIDSIVIADNWEDDGPTGYYTLFHRIPGGMAKLVSGDACGYYIGNRGGMSNETPNYVNATPIENGAFMTIYNTMPFPLTPEALTELMLISPAAGNFTITGITQNTLTFSWQGANGSIGYEFTVNGTLVIPNNPTLTMQSVMQSAMRSAELTTFGTAPSYSISVIGSTATVTGLSPGTTYAISVISIALGGGKTYSSSLYVLTAPGNPTNLMTTSVTTDGFSIRWMGGIGATSYRFTLNGMESIPQSYTNSSAIFSGLTPNTVFNIGITAINSNSETTSEEGFAVRTGPGAPSGFIISPSATSIVVEWSGSDGATAFTYYLDDVTTIPTSAQTASSPYMATFAGLLPNTEYTIRIVANGNNSSSTSSVLNVVQTNGPPINLVANAITGTSFSVSWSGSIDTASYTYTLNGNNPSFYGITATTLGRSVVFTNTAVNTTYSVIVMATSNADTTSSAPISVTTLPSAPAAPVVTSNTITSTGFTLSWTGATGATSYYYSINGSIVVPNSSTSNSATFSELIPAVTYSSIIVTATNLGGSTPSVPISVTTLTPPPIKPILADGIITSTSITVSWQAVTYATSYEYRRGGIVTTPSATTSNSATFTGLSSDTLYEFTVKAINSAGNVISDARTIRTRQIAPTAPVLSSSTITYNTFTISWLAGTNATSYSYTLNDVPTIPASSTSTSATFNGLNSDTDYSVIVTGGNNEGSASSNPISVRTLSASPLAPTDLVGSFGDEKAILTWTLASEGGSPITNYKYSTDNGVSYTLFSSPISGSTATAMITELTNGMTYTIRIKAVNIDGDSLASNSVTVTPMRVLITVGGEGTGTLAYSYNGTTFLASDDGRSKMQICKGIAFNGDRWVAVGQTLDPVNGQNTILYSDNGTTWTASTNGNSRFSGAGGHAVAWSGTRWVAGGAGTVRIAYSDDGINWVGSTSGSGSDGFLTTCFAVASNGTRWVAGGGGGSNKLIYSSNGIDWTPSPSGNAILSSYCYSVAWNGTLWIAGGSSSTNRLAYSSDGMNWNASITGGLLISRCKTLAWNGSLWVGGGLPVSTGGITSIYSSDGMNWNSNNLHTILNIECNSIIWTGTQWLAAGDGSFGDIAYSPDGISWTVLNQLGNIFTDKVNILATRQILYMPILPAAPLAPTGLQGTSGNEQAVLTWTPPSTDGSPITNYKYSTNNGANYTAFNPVVSGLTATATISNLMNGTTYTILIKAVNAGGDGAASTSVIVTPVMTPSAPTGLSGVPDNGQVLLTWTPPSTDGSPITNYKYSTNNGANYTAFNPVVSGLTATATISNLMNGTTYTILIKAVNAGGDGAASTPITVTPVMPRFMVAGGVGGRRSTSSVDGITWTSSVGMDTIIIDACKAVAFDGSRWIAGGNDGDKSNFGYSTDGLNWTYSGNGKLIITDECNALASNGSRWVAGGAGVNALAYLDNGFTWVASSQSASIGRCKAVACNGTRWVAGGDGINRLIYSDDGDTWTPSLDIATIGVCNAVACNGTRWVAGGDGNKIVYSNDGGINWIPSSNGNDIFSFKVYAVAWNGSRWVAGGHGTNRLAYSNDGINWIASSNGNQIFNYYCSAVAWNGSRWVAGGYQNNILAYSNDNGVTWIASINGNDYWDECKSLGC